MEESLNPTVNKKVLIKIVDGFSAMNSSRSESDDSVNIIYDISPEKYMLYQTYMYVYAEECIII